MPRKLAFWLYFVLLVWGTHALGYLVHEYAHSFTAWALGYKANPLDLIYGRLTPRNVLFLNDIDENVDYGAVFAAGKGYLASSIALAGMLIGNGIPYFLCLALYFFARRRNRRMLALFAFLYCLMNVGNFVDYVPVRTFTTHSDMATLEKGLHLSPWWVVIVLGLPIAAALWHFFARLLPDARDFLFPGKTGSQVILTALSAFAVFVFYGSAGMRGYGAVSHRISVFSMGVAFPLVLILCWPRKRNPASAA
jgi:hypothetical protein